MSELTIHRGELQPLPAPRVAISVRPATMDDLPFMDRLQKQNSKALGYFPTKQFEGYIAMGGVLVAVAKKETGDRSQETEGMQNSDSCLLTSDSFPLGYVISRDRYLKRDELGVIYQLCVTPGEQRKLVGAALVQAVFERSAYGCRLYCCWCAQDLAANYFWESLGFVPVAFRTGSTKKKVGSRQRAAGSGNELPAADCQLPAYSARVHIFWQKRIGRGDDRTPWWFPSKTESGALRADRLVLPIPPGVHWSEVMPVEGEDRVSGVGSRVSGEEKRKRVRGSSRNPTPETRTPRTPVQFGRPGATMPAAETPPAPPADVPAVRVKREKPKCDPKLVSAARELRDRWLEEVNAGRYSLEARGKYHLGRALPAQPADTTPLLPAA